MYNLKIISEEARGIIKINENCQFNKVRAEKVVVNENITARLFGSVKTIVLKKGAKLFLHGVISGTVKNNGGEIYVF
jgi:hypothetical protein